MVLLLILGFSLCESKSWAHHRTEMEVLNRDVECRYEFPQKWHLADLHQRFPTVENQTLASDLPGRIAYVIRFLFRQYRVDLGRWPALSLPVHQIIYVNNDTRIHPKLETMLHFSTLQLIRFRSFNFLCCILFNSVCISSSEQAMVEVKDHRPLALQCYAEEKTKLGAACWA